MDYNIRVFRLCDPVIRLLRTAPNDISLFVATGKVDLLYIRITATGSYRICTCFPEILLTKLFRQKCYDTVIVLCLVRKCTIRTFLYQFPVWFNIAIISRACFQWIKRTITKQTIKLLRSFVARVILAILIAEILIWIVHTFPAFPIGTVRQP